MVQIVVKSLLNSESVSSNFDFPESLFSMRCTDNSVQMVYSVDFILKKGSFAHTKDRGEVSGTTKKAYKQKGTGKARHGTLRAPQFRGGGVAFGPKFSTRRVKINKNLRLLATLTCLNRHIERNSLILLDNFYIDNCKTKYFSSTISNFFGKDLSSDAVAPSIKENGCLFIDSKKFVENDEIQSRNFKLASRNIIGTKFLDEQFINVSDLLRHGIICITKEALEKIVARFQEKFVKFVGA